MAANGATRSRRSKQKLGRKVVAMEFLNAGELDLAMTNNFMTRTNSRLKPRHTKTVDLHRYLFVVLMFITANLMFLPCGRSSEGKQKTVRRSLVNEANIKKKNEEVNPRDFAVPARAFASISVVQFGGGTSVKSKSFLEWLKRTGKFGERVAINDRRFLGQVLGDEDDDDVIRFCRVCDIAYLVLRKKYGAPPASYRMKRQKLDELNKALDVAIEKSQSKKHTPKQVAE